MAGLRKPTSSPTRKNAVTQLPPSLGSSLVMIWRRLSVELEPEGHQVEAAEVRLQRALQAVFGEEHGGFHDRVGGRAEGPAADAVIAERPTAPSRPQTPRGRSRPARPAAARQTESGTPAPEGSASQTRIASARPGRPSRRPGRPGRGCRAAPTSARAPPVPAAPGTRPAPGK